MDWLEYPVIDRERERERDREREIWTDLVR